MFLYAIEPIDFWDGWTKAEDYQFPTDGFASYTKPEFEAHLRVAKAAARGLGWEDDIREGPFISGLPVGAGSYGVMIAWKQDNNGQTFVYSPERLMWLESDYHKNWVKIRSRQC